MQSEDPGRDLAYRAQEAILRIRDVRSCRVVCDETGAISEIHVIAASDRQPKMIARDVEAMLKAELGFDIDYRKIGVVLIDNGFDAEGSAPAAEAAAAPPPAGFAETPSPADFSAAPPPDDFSAAPPPAEKDTPVPVDAEGEAELEILEDCTRIEYRGFRLEIERDSLSAEVTLSRDGREACGTVAGERDGPACAAIARAAVRALSELLDETSRLCLSEIREVEVTGRKALIAVVEVGGGRDSRSYTGCAFTGADPNEAAVLAVLDAVNRPFGRWKSRREIHFRIR